MTQIDQLNTALAAYRIPGKVVNAVEGPRVISYHIQLEPGFVIKKLLRVSLEIAVALSVESVRIHPVAALGVIAIDVPKKDPQKVTFEDCALTTHWHSPRHLPIMFGVDSAGEPIVGDLVDMPHLLIAGSTGSGKSVALNSILCGLINKTSPAEMRLQLVDPKAVELSAFAQTAHADGKAVSPSETLSMLTHMQDVMESRYSMLQVRHYRNLVDYNKAVDPVERLPFIVVVIDELADLTMSELGGAIQDSLVRLAQKARAAGIHIIAATQRPVVKVVTGLIKVNFPTRLALRVPSQIDSKTILDQPGAERLLGNGDALLLMPGKDLIRVQGPFTSDQIISDSVFRNTTVSPARSGLARLVPGKYGWRQ